MNHLSFLKIQSGLFHVLQQATHLHFIARKDLFAYPESVGLVVWEAAKRWSGIVGTEGDIVQRGGNSRHSPWHGYEHLVLVPGNAQREVVVGNVRVLVSIGCSSFRDWEGNF